MPRGRGRRFRTMIAGLLFLSILVMSIVQAQAMGLPCTQGAIVEAPTVAHEMAMAGDLWRSADVQSGAPCRGHDGMNGPTCCLAGGCPILLGWLPVSATVLPAIAPMVAVYRDPLSVLADGVRPVPTLPPPRYIA